jgi:hypothetical protein
VGEFHPQIEELVFGLNTSTQPNGGIVVDFGAPLFGTELHCSTYDPAVFGSGPPNYGWGALDPVTNEPVLGVCPNIVSGVGNNFDIPLHGTSPIANRVETNGAAKTPSLRNVELTGPYFHTGSYLTLRQVVQFYMRGGDFPITDKQDRDPRLVNIEKQAFGFGRTKSVNGDLDPFSAGLPEYALYDEMPDTDHPITPEPTTSTPEEAEEALVRFLLSLTDQRVKYQQAPFDHPEIFVPVDGRAGENTGGRNALLADPAFQQLPALGADGDAAPLEGFLGVASSLVPGDNNDHFDLGETIVGAPPDTAAPFVRDLKSLSHPQPDVAYADNNPVFEWVASDPSGVSGYSYELDRDPGTVPDPVSEGSQTSAAFAGKADGTWYFHVRAQDGAGNWGETAHRAIRVGTQLAVTSPATAGPFSQGSTVPASWELATPVDEGWLVVYAVSGAGDHHWLATLPAVPGQSAYNYAWKVSQPAGVGYRLRVWYVDGDGNWLYFDDSDPGFEIVASPPQPTVTSPSTAGPFNQGSILDVTWELAAAADDGWLVAYALGQDNAHHWLATLPAVAGQTVYEYSWGITQAPGTGYRVRVWYVDGAGNWLYFDDSEPAFEIVAADFPQPTVTSPSAPGPFNQGSVLDVTWELAAATDGGWLVAYAVEEDYTHHWLATLPAVAGQTLYDYTWGVTQPPGTGYRVRVWYVDLLGNWLYFDDSEPAFEVVAADYPQPTVNSPNTAGPFIQGSVQSIGWELAGAAEGGWLVAYLVAANNTHYWLGTQEALPGELVYSQEWNVSEPVGTGYHIRVWYVDAPGNWLYYDDSEPAFSIAAP